VAFSSRKSHLAQCRKRQEVNRKRSGVPNQSMAESREGEISRPLFRWTGQVVCSQVADNPGTSRFTDSVPFCPHEFSCSKAAAFELHCCFGRHGTLWRPQQLGRLDDRRHGSNAVRIECFDGKVVALFHIEGADQKRVLAVDQPRRIEFVGSDAPPHVVTLAARLGGPANKGISPIVSARNLHASHCRWWVAGDVAKDAEAGDR